MKDRDQPLNAVLIGQSNSGKTTLFNTLTGYRQNVANYAGVTVDCKTGYFTLPSGRPVQITDLPGIYSFHSISPDEAITSQFFKKNHTNIDVVLCVVDATNLALHLKLALQVQQLGKPMVILLNRIHAATQDGIKIDIGLLKKQLGVFVIPTEVKSAKDIEALIQWLDSPEISIKPSLHITLEDPAQLEKSTISYNHAASVTLDDHIDRWVLHPWWGPIILIGVMSSMFQAIFLWAEPIKQLIEASINSISVWLTHALTQHSLLYSLINEGLFAGVGTILAFCPQILLLFSFIFILEECGYLPRAVFLLDHLLFKAGLTGRAFIPLLSSFACTIPSIMATRNIRHPRDRLITILVLPLITCSARLPIYILLIAAFIPAKNTFYGLLSLQGIVLFGLYLVGMSSALGVAWMMKKLQHDPTEPMLLMELPRYQLPNLQDILLGVWEQLRLFFYRIGSVILALTVLLWASCRFPLPPPDATHPAIYYSLAGYLGRLLSLVFKPIGFDWQICIALIPGLMAREVAISALGTVYAMSGNPANVNQLSTMIAQEWSLATALSLLAWYVFAPQCLSTLTVIKRETRSWSTMAIAAGYLFSLAYLASFITYQVASLCQ